MSDDQTPQKDDQAEEAKTEEQKDVEQKLSDPRDFKMPEPLPKSDHTRKRAEKTASPLSYQTLLLKGHLEQDYEINKHIKVKNRSISAGVGEFVGQLLSERYDQAWGLVFEEAARMYYLAASLQEVNGEPIGPEFDHFVKKSDFDKAKDAFDKRLEFVRGLVGSLMYLLYNHYLLFNMRVDDFVKGSDEELGNS